MKIHQIIAIGAISAFGAALAGSAYAQGIPPPGGTPGKAPAAGTDEYTKLDSDKDGMVSKKEAEKNKDLAKRWDDLDVNKDGKLDQGEFARFESSADEGGKKPADKPRF